MSYQRRRLWALAGALVIVTAPLRWVASASDQPEKQPGADITGIVVLDGEPPPAREWPLDKEMAAASGEKVYREETWLVGENRRLANCVVTLRAKDPAQRIAPRPLREAVLDKVGVRYVPRVLVVTPGTEVVLRNKASICRGFQIHGNPRFDHGWNFLVQEGTHAKATFRDPDTCSVTCPVRPYTKGYIKVVDTPHFAASDVRGQFSIRNLRPAKYEVTVWHEAAGTLTADAGPAEITIVAGADQKLRYRVKPAPHLPKK